MDAQERILVNFDFRSDTSGYPKRDPDACSPTLRPYHKYLWSKPLPNGVVFDLDDTTRHYLHHKSEALGEFFLASSAVIPSPPCHTPETDLCFLCPPLDDGPSRRSESSLGRGM